MHAFLGVPILLGDKPLGQLYLADKIDHPEFTEQDERVIETLAAYAAVAITNSRMYEEILERDSRLIQTNEDLNLLNEVAEKLASSFYVEDIIEKTLLIVNERMDIDAAEIYLREDGEKELQLVLRRGDFTDTFFYRDHFKIGQGQIGSVTKTGNPTVCIDFDNEIEHLRPNLIDEGFECIGFVPLSSSREVIGVLAAATRNKSSLDERGMNLLTSIGNWAGITIENARLNRQSRRLAVLEERERIGMDLHDGIIQSIYGVGLTLDYVRMLLTENPENAKSKIDESIGDLNEAIRDIRAYILDLRPRQFHGEDLKQGLQRLVDEFRANSGTTAIMVGPENGVVDFPADHATALFHICQEALANVAKHSNAKYAEIHLWVAKDRVLLEVSDNGVGFDLQKMSVTLGHGLSNMHVRARKVGGDVEITSNPGQGTTILAWVPRWAS
jgi:signal transduction histidine kinase